MISNVLLRDPLAQALLGHFGIGADPQDAEILRLLDRADLSSPSSEAVLALLQDGLAGMPLLRELLAASEAGAAACRYRFGFIVPRRPTLIVPHMPPGLIAPVQWTLPRPAAASNSIASRADAALLAEYAPVPAVASRRPVSPAGPTALAAAPLRASMASPAAARRHVTGRRRLRGGALATLVNGAVAAALAVACVLPSRTIDVGRPTPSAEEKPAPWTRVGAAFPLVALPPGRSSSKLKFAILAHEPSHNPLVAASREPPAPPSSATKATQDRPVISAPAETATRSFASISIADAIPVASRAPVVSRNQPTPGRSRGAQKRKSSAGLRVAAAQVTRPEAATTALPDVLKPQ